MVKNQDKARVIEVATRAVLMATPVIGPIFLMAEQLANASGKLAAQGNIQELKKQEETQEIALRMAVAQAKVAQELAIAQRIARAEIVEIEEFYDNSGEGAIGVQGDEVGLSIGARGAGKRVTRRKYRFSGLLEDVGENATE